MELDEKKQYKTDKDYTKKLVIKITTPVQKKGYNLFADSWYISPELLLELGNLGITATGIVNKNRKNLPKSDNDEEIKIATTGKINYVNFKDKKSISCLSTRFDSTSIEISKESETEKKEMPNALFQYKNFSHGVDKMNQMSSYYSISKRSVKWWKRIFYFLVDVTIYNAYVLWDKVSAAEKNFMDFRIMLMYQLSNLTPYLENYEQPQLLSNDIFLVNGIKCVKMESLHHLSKSELPKECKCCSGILGKRKRTRYKCIECGENLHPECFTNYHIKKVYR